jgi:hypothetical protein
VSGEKFAPHKRLRHPNNPKKGMQIKVYQKTPFSMLGKV